MRDMNVVNASEQVCCTCNFWTGSRIVGEDGYVYSMKSLEGVCRAVRREPGTERSRALALPGDSCPAWEIWPEIGKGE